MSDTTAIPLPPKQGSSSGKNRLNSRRRYRWILKLSVWLFVVALVFGIVGSAIGLFYAKPRYELAQSFDLEEIDDLEVASLIIDRKGEEIGRIFVQNRQPIPIEKVSPNFTQALLAAEDARFHVHGGVDYIGILRAAILNLQAGEITQGASTITQQLARNAFDLKEKSISRKVTEAFLSKRIEAQFSKEEILELYLNRIYFGSGYWGISAAANGYFGKKAEDLSISESATLAGVIRNPYYRSPHNFPDAAKKTRDYVLKRMRSEGMIDKKQLEMFQEEPLMTIPKGSATGKSKYVYEYVRQRVIELIGYEKASRGGFKISTTIDNRVQREAEKYLTRQLDEIEKRPGYEHQTVAEYKRLKKAFLDKAPSGKEEEAKPPPPEYLQGATLMIENRTGAIVALVGGRDFNDSMYDRTTQARRPPGTSFKPFVYATAFESGLFPGTLVDDSPIDNKFVQIGGEQGILGEWGPENLENIYEGQITARAALAKSKNAATVRLGVKAGLEKVVALGEKAGIAFRGDRRNFNATLLGLSEASMEEMCVAYTIFPNRGSRPKRTYMISSIRDSSGKEVYTPDLATRSEGAVDLYTAFQITSCLEDALRHGTGKKAYSESGLRDFPAAGKTGTEYGFTDNWFIGFTTEVTCAVWAGFDQPRRIYQGAFSNETVLPVWAAMMNAAEETFTAKSFVPPANAMKVEICAVSGELATDACYEVDQSGTSARHIRSTYVEYLRPGTRVTNVCPEHGAPGAKPRTVPQLDPDLLSLAGNGERPGVTNGGALRANPVVSSDPVIPVAPTVLGDDPYNAFAPRLQARAIIPKSLRETPPEKIETEDPAVPATNEEGLPIARPISPLPNREGEDPAEENRVKLPSPKPIQFD